MELAVNDIIQQMEDDIQKFGENMEQYATDLENRMKRETKKHLLKMPKKPEVHHQYGMLFNHHCYVMAGHKEPSVIPRDRSTQDRGHLTRSAGVP